MGTQGLSGRVGLRRRRGDRACDDRVVHWRLNVIAALAILPIAAGCSSSPPWSSSANPPANQTAAVPPPPNYPATAAGQPAYAPPPGQQTYTPPPGQQAYAPAAQSPPPDQNTVGSFRQSYSGFLQMFRDPPEQDPAAQNARPSPPPTQQAYAPRPPSTYTPSQQPYAQPQGQPAYSPPPAQQNYQQAPAQQNYAPRSGQQSYAAPPTKPAYVAPAATAAAAPPPAQQDYSELATLSEAVACRGVPRLDANASSRSDPRRNPRRNPRHNSSRYPGAAPIRTASAEHLHAVRSALLPAAGPAGQQRPATGRDRRRGASRQSRPHQLAALSEAVAVRGFLEQAIKSCFVAAILDLKT